MYNISINYILNKEKKMVLLKDDDKNIDQSIGLSSTSLLIMSNLYIGFISLLITITPIHKFYVNGNYFALLMLGVASLIAILIGYTSDMMALRYYKYKKVLKKHKAKFVIFEDDKIIFHYDDRKIIFKAGNVLDTKYYILQIRDKSLVLCLSNCYFYCENKYNQEEMNYMTKILKKIQKSTLNNQFTPTDNQLSIIKDLKTKIYLCLYNHILALIISIILMLIVVIIYCLGYRFGQSFLMTYFTIVAPLFTFTLICRIKEHLNRLKQITNLYLDKECFQLVNQNNIGISCKYNDIIDIKIFKDHTIIDTFSTGFILAKNDQNIELLKEKLRR